jgi:hypothetical protein
MPNHVFKILVNIIHKLSSVSPIANLRNWVTNFYNLSKHFSLYVLVLPGKNVSTFGYEGGFREPDHKSPPFLKGDLGGF